MEVSTAGRDQEAARGPGQCGSGVWKCNAADLPAGGGIDYGHAAVGARDRYRWRAGRVIGGSERGHRLGKAGLQRVRVCDVAEDPTAAVMVFGAAPLPEGVPMLRVLRADPLRVLHADRERKRLLWERMQTLGRGGP